MRGKRVRVSNEPERAGVSRKRELVSGDEGVEFPDRELRKQSEERGGGASIYEFLFNRNQEGLDWCL